MIGRFAATAGAVVPVALASAVPNGAATVTTPTIWYVLGYPFEAGSMIASLCACAAVRFWAVQKEFKQHRWTLDAPVSALALMFTAAAVIRLRPDPAMALVYGTGLGILGAGIIAIAKKNVDRVLAAMGLVTDTPLADAARAGEVVAVPAGSGAPDGVSIQPQLPDNEAARTGANLRASYRSATTQPQPSDQQAALRDIDKADQPPA